MIQRGDIYWADLGQPVPSAPAKRRPVVIVQADSFNASRINTVLAAVITSNERLAAAPGNVALSRKDSRLSRDSVVNVSQVVTLDKVSLSERVSSLAPETMTQITAGLRLVIDLSICHPHLRRSKGRIRTLEGACHSGQVGGVRWMT